MAVELVPVSFEGTKELHEVGVALEKALVGVDGALADGKVELAEVITVITGALGELSAAVEGLHAVSAEVKEYPTQAVLGALVPVGMGIGALLKKDA